MAPLDPWIIEEIKKREEEERRKQERRIELPLEEPRERPETPSPDPKPGYEMPTPGDPKREERPSEKKEDSGRGVTTIDIGGGSDDEDADEKTIDISKLPDIPPEDAFEERSE